MAKNKAGIIKGIGAGLIAGMIVGFAGSAMLMDNKKYKRKAAKAADTIEDLVEGVKEVFTG